MGVMDKVPNGNDLGNENSDNVRAKLLWDASDDVSLLLSADYTRARENAAPATLVDAERWQQSGGIAGLYNACVAGMGPPACNSVIDGRTGNSIDPQFTSRTPYDNRFLTGDDFKTYGNAVSGTALDSWGVSATLDWQLSDDVSLKSISAYRKLDSVFGEDADMSPLVIDHHAFELNQEQYSQEIQLTGASGSLTWLAGLYYFHEDGENNDFVPLAGGLFQVYGPNDITNTSVAVFGRATYDITEQFAVTGGLRWTREDKEFVGRQRDLNGLSAQLGVPPEAFPDPNDLTRLYPLGTQEQDFSNVSLLVSAEYHFSDEVFGYVSYSQGFKGGGWDTRLTGPELVAPEFAEEEADTFEVGFKSQLLDNSLRLNAAAFYTEHENLQLIIQRGISPLTANAGESEIKGLELDFTWLPTENLEVVGSYGWTDAEYTKLDERANQVGIFLSNEFNNTPEHSAALSVDYTQYLASKGSLNWHIDYTWKDDQFNDAVNTPELQQEAFGLVGVSLTYTSADERWYLGAGVQNLTDKEYIMSGFNQPGVGFIYQTMGRPREAWVNLGMKF
jgi:iron complex outermembrane receptor protein